MASRIAAIATELGLEQPSVAPLPGGLANRSWRLRDARQDLVLRQSGAATPLLGANRAAEIAMQGLASGAGLAPEILLGDSAQGFIVTRHVSGGVPSRSDVRVSSYLERVGAWIARLHALVPPPGLPVIDFGARAAAYLELLQARKRQALVAGIAARLALRRVALAPPACIVACHHDLHHRNFVDAGESLLVLDWEYAGPGDAAADLASCIGYHDLGSEQVEALLAGYGRDSVPLRARLVALGWIFDCLWFGWNAVAALAGLESDPELQDRLVARLTG